MENFKLTIRTPNQDVFEGEVTSVHFNAEGGEMECLAHHASVTATIAFTSINLKTVDGSESFIARNGIFLFDNDTNSALFLVFHCEKKSEISKTTVEDYAKFIDQQLREGKSLSEFQIAYLEGEKLAVEKQLEEIGE